MRLNSNPVMMLFGFILILVGAGSFFGYRIYPHSQTFAIAMLVLAALLVISVVSGWIKEAMGVLVMALWLILAAISYMFHLQFAYQTLILNILPVGAGIFMLLGL